MQKVLIKTGYSCNNDCIICHSNKFRIFYKDSSLKQIKNKILIAKNKGYRFILLSGGEPTIRKDFLQVAEFIKKQGMVFGIITNGRMLSYSAFLKKLVNLNLKYVYISLLGSEAKIHNKIANTDSFNNTLKGIKNVLKESSIEYLINITVIKSNMDDLKNIVHLLSYLGAKKIKFSFIDYKGKIKNNYTEEIPRISEAAERVKEAIDYSIEKGMEAFFDGFPSCLMIGYQNKLNNLFTNKIILMSESYESEFFKVDNFNRIKPEKCNSCEFYKKCIGLEKEYLALFGINELRPLRKISNSAAFFYEKNIKNLNKKDKNFWNKIFLKKQDCYEVYSYNSSDFNRSEIENMKKKEQVYFINIKNNSRKFFSEMIKLKQSIKKNIFEEQKKEVFCSFEKMLKKEIFNMGGKILDVGCGKIHFKKLFEFMVSSGKIKYFGLDPITPFTNKKNMTFIRSSLEEYHPHNDSFDFILMLGSYNHLLDPLSSLKKLKRCLKNGGLLLITDNEAHIALNKVSKSSRDKKEFEHYRNSSLYEVKSLLLKQKFEIIKEIPVTKDTSNNWIILAKNKKNFNQK